MRRLRARLTGLAAVALAFGAVLLLASPATALNTDPSPTRTIGGLATGIVNLNNVAVSPDGTVFVTNTNDAETIGSILGYAPNADGDVAPTTAIAGSNTGLVTPTGIALDPAGNIWVTDFGANTLDEFAAGTTGNVAPIVTIAGADTQLRTPSGIAIGSDGALYVADNGDRVLVFAHGSVGNVPPSRVITGSNTRFLERDVWGIALHTDGSIVVSDNAGVVETFAANADGNATPLRTISGSRTGLDDSDNLALDTFGNIYVANADVDTVTKYPATANGNVPPAFRVVEGASQLNGPYAIATDASDNVYVTNARTETITIYPPIITATGALNVTAVSPSTGSGAGGQSVTVTGTRFTAGVTVTFGGVAATHVTVLSSTTLTAVVPAHAMGTVDVTVTQSTGCACDHASATLDDAYTFDPALATTGVDASSGIFLGGTLLALGSALLLTRRRARSA